VGGGMTPVQRAACPEKRHVNQQHKKSNKMA
jgi:hypothetical protein